MISMSDREEYQQVKKITAEARKLKQEKKYSQARQLLQEGLENYPENIYLKTSLGDLLVRMNQIARARELSREVLQEKPEDDRALTVLGNAAYRSREFEEAREYFQAAYQQKESGYLAFRLINVLNKMGKYQEAEELAREWYNKTGKAKFKKLLGNALEKQGKYGEAEKYIADYLKEKPEDDFAYRQKIKLKLEKLEPEKAVQELRKLLNIGGGQDKQELKLLLGQKLKEAGRMEEAVDVFQSFLADNPENLFARKLLGFALYKQREYDKSLPHLKEVLKEDPNDYYTRNTLEAAFRKAEKQREGMNFFQELIQETGLKKYWSAVNKLAREVEAENNEQT